MRPAVATAERCTLALLYPTPSIKPALTSRSHVTGAALAVTTVSLVAVLLDSMETKAEKAGAIAASLPSMQEAEGEGEGDEVFNSTRN